MCAVQRELSLRSKRPRLSVDLAFSRYHPRRFRQHVGVKEFLQAFQTDLIQTQLRVDRRVCGIALRHRSAISLNSQFLFSLALNMRGKVEREWLSGCVIANRQIDVIVNGPRAALL